VIVNKVDILAHIVELMRHEHQVFVQMGEALKQLQSVTKSQE
jgi:hypothetical protein